jgi:N-acetylmuramoyl-L-alanine amidase
MIELAKLAFVLIFIMATTPMAFLLMLFFISISGCVAHLTHTTSSSPTLEALAKIQATVVIDPGHGGADSGAMSKSGLLEKDLCLDISKRIARLISKVMPRVKIIMTREIDKAVSLEERIKIANAAQGDVFLSIHINSNENEDAHGFEVYSLDIASDRHAERIAMRENKTNKDSSGVNFILADLRANNHRYASDQLAKLIAKNLILQVSKKVGAEAVNNRGYNQAIFSVLFVNMPAVLAELFFISNPHDERRLRTEAMRESCARGVVAGLGMYLKNLDTNVVRTAHVAK